MLQRIMKISDKTWIRCVCTILNTVLVFSLLLSFVASMRVNGDSMNPTLEDGAFYLGTAYFSLSSGDIVIADSDALGLKIVKRVIAVPGDTIAITNNTVYRNGLPLTEDYIAEPMVTEDIDAFTLGEDMYFLMGDNRNDSADSRQLGLFSQEDIRYKVFPQTRYIVFLIGFICVCLTQDAICRLSELETRWMIALLSRRKQHAAVTAESN